MTIKLRNYKGREDFFCSIGFFDGCICAGRQVP
jgi:hypothetical protein